MENIQALIVFQKVAVAILTSDKVDFGVKEMISNKEDYIMIKASIKIYYNLKCVCI
jgi:hypothetical protein